MVWLKKKPVAKEIQKFPLANSSTNNIYLFITPQQPKHNMVAMEKNQQKSCSFEKGVFFSCSCHMQ